MRRLLIVIFFLACAAGCCLGQDTNKRSTFNIGTCKLLIAGRTSGDIGASIKQLTDNPTLTLLSACSDCKVVSFQLGATLAGVSYLLSAKGNKLTPEMLNLLQQTPSGSHIIIENVLIRHPDGTNECIPGKNISIY